MAIKFNPQASNESATLKEVLPEGIYKFKVSSAKEKTSQGGNPMVETVLQVHNKHTSGQVKDFLGAWAYGEVKIIGFLESVGLPTISGEVHVNQIVGRSGYLKLVVKDSTNPKYPGPQNNVARYYTQADLVREKLLPASAVPITNPEPPAPVIPTSLDDLSMDLPF